MRSLPGSAWFSDADQTDATVVCRPVDEVAGVGRFTLSFYKLWTVLKGLPLP